MALVREQRLVISGQTINGDITHTGGGDTSSRDGQQLQQILEHLEEMQTERLPLIRITCTCDGQRPRHGESMASTTTQSDDDSGSNSDEDGVHVKDIIKAIELYKLKGKPGKNTVVKTLISSFECQEDIDDSTVEKLLNFIDHDNWSVCELGWLTVAQLCQRDSNVFKFLFHDVANKALETLRDNEASSVKEAAAVALAKIVSAPDLLEMYSELMMSEGLEVLNDCMGPRQPAGVRHSSACVVRALAVHSDMAILIIDQLLPAVAKLKELNTECQEVYTEVLTNLLAHTDYTRASVLNIDALPTALNMLRNGPCASQVQGLLLMEVLSHSQYGLKAVLEHGLVPYIMSALLDSQCKKVVSHAVATVHALTATRKSSFQKQLLVQIDKFYHEHEEHLGIMGQIQSVTTKSSGHLRTDTSSRVQRAMKELAQALVMLLQKYGRMVVDDRGHVTQVHISPCIDTDPTLLQVLTQLVETFGNLVHFKLSRPKLRGSGATLDESKGDKVYPHAAKILMDKGAQCMLDLLHVYAVKCEQAVQSVQHQNSKLSQTQAWCAKLAASCRSTGVSTRQLFDKAELQLLGSVLDVVMLFTRCASEDNQEDILESFKAETQVVSNPDSSPRYKKKSSPSKSPRKNRTPTPQCERRSQTPDITNSSEDKHQRELQSLQRVLRVALYNSGLIESVSPFLLLTTDTESIKCRIHKILENFSQSVSEKIHSPAKTELGHLKRPVSAMTSQERDHKLHLAARQMLADTAAALNQSSQKQQKESVQHHNQSVPVSVNVDQPVSETVSQQGEITKETNTRNTVKVKGQDESEAGSNCKVKVTEKGHVIGQAESEAGSNGCVRVTEDLSDRKVKDEDNANYLGVPRPRTPATQYEDCYEKFKRAPSRPQSAKARSRPQSAGANRQRTRPSSAHILKTDKSESEERKDDQGERNSIRPSSGKSKMNDSASKENAGSSNIGQPRPRSGSRSRPTSATVKSGKDEAGQGDKTVNAAHSVKSQHIVKPSPPSSAGRREEQMESRAKSGESKMTAGTRVNSAGSNRPPSGRKSRPNSGVMKAVRQHEKLGPLPWKPKLDPLQFVTGQCRNSVVSQCCRHVVKDLLSKSLPARQEALVFLYSLVKMSDTAIHMKLSECGLVRSLVDFLRISEDEAVTQMLALRLTQLLVKSDVRLLQLFQQVDASQLLLTMVNSTSDALKQEVIKTLKVLTKEITTKPAPRSGRRLWSAPPGGVRCPPDIWDQIMLRWKEEDDVMLMLRKVQP